MTAATNKAKATRAAAARKTAKAEPSTGFVPGVGFTSPSGTPLKKGKTMTKPAAKKSASNVTPMRRKTDKLPPDEKAKLLEKEAKAAKREAETLAKAQARENAKAERAAARERKSAEKQVEKADRERKAFETRQARGTTRIGQSVVNLERYMVHEAVTPSGRHVIDNNDEVAAMLRGATLDRVYELAAAALEVPEADLRKQYKTLNPGMQRMNLGNRIRGAGKAKQKAQEKLTREQVREEQKAARAAQKAAKVKPLVDEKAAARKAAADKKASRREAAQQMERRAAAAAKSVGRRSGKPANPKNSKPAANGRERPVSRKAR